MDASPTLSTSPDEGIVDVLASHRVLLNVPRDELVWLAAHGRLVRRTAGEVVVKAGNAVTEMQFVLSGHIEIHVDRGLGPRKVMEWGAGDVTGLLPFSRMTRGPGDSFVSGTTETFSVSKEEFPELIRECPVLAGTLVHLMVDRARHFMSVDLLDEKMMSLGRLSAGLAHELNNPASAAARAASFLLDSLVTADTAGRALGGAGLTVEQVARVDEVRDLCIASASKNLTVESPIELADREDALAEWCEQHQANPGVAHALARTAVQLDQLDALASHLPPAAIDLVLRWIASGCNVRGLASDIQRAATRIHDLVMAIKRFSYMDRAKVLELVDVGRSLSDTVAVMAYKARERGASIALDYPDDLPAISGRGSELNQVWLNLLDNALDAVKGRANAHVRIGAGIEGTWMVVRLSDNGPGIPPELQHRVFDPFFTTKGVGQGTGLGLDTVQKVVRSHNGEVDVSSEPGRTEFRVALPLVPMP